MPTALLRLTSARVAEIAEACSFNSIYSFSRAFQAAYGMSPLQYRRADQAPRAATTTLRSGRASGPGEGRSRSETT